ncbi:MAG: hypothetical protein HKN68_13595 [Saprospiraceae bacterium]|nr:hypothetical protein [Saprospiraceae bacterium]
MHTRIGRPVEHLAHGYTKQLASPIYATAVGLLKTSIENMDRTYVEMEEVEEAETAIHQDPVRESSEGKWYNKIYAITRDFFDPKPDSDF